MWLLFVPILIVLAFVFSVGGVFWAFGGAWPWLLIGLGAWMFWHEDSRYRGSRSADRGSRQRGRTRPSKTTPGIRLVPAEVPQSPIPAPRSPKELPIDIQVKVEQIRRKVEVLLGYADRFPPFSQDLYLVRQTASEYLPRTINAFLAIPLETVDQPLAMTGRTARDELKAQLDLLDSKLDEIAQDLQRQDADRLLANRRFLESRFSEHRGDSPLQGSASGGVA